MEVQLCVQQFLLCLGEKEVGKENRRKGQNCNAYLQCFIPLQQYIRVNDTDRSGHDSHTFL